MSGEESKIWGVCCETFGEYCPSYNEIQLHFLSYPYNDMVYQPLATILLRIQYR